MRVAHALFVVMALLAAPTPVAAATTDAAAVRESAGSLNQDTQMLAIHTSNTQWLVDQKTAAEERLAALRAAVREGRHDPLLGTSEDVPRHEARVEEFRARLEKALPPLAGFARAVQRRRARVLAHLDTVRKLRAAQPPPALDPALEAAVAKAEADVALADSWLQRDVVKQALALPPPARPPTKPRGSR